MPGVTKSSNTALTPQVRPENAPALTLHVVLFVPLTLSQPCQPKKRQCPAGKLEGVAVIDMPTPTGAGSFTTTCCPQSLLLRSFWSLFVQAAVGPTIVPAPWIVMLARTVAASAVDARSPTTSRIGSAISAKR